MSTPRIGEERKSRSALAPKSIKPIRLSPVFIGADPLLQALQLRQAIRDISDRALPMRMLSELLWAACGINREKGPFGLPGRTAASASNSQEIDLYVALPEATYLYAPLTHRLV